MAILSSNETLESRRASGRFREANSYTRSFLVHTDRTDESLLNIGASCGISYGDPHPDDPSAYCIGFDVQPVGGDMCLLYNVNFEYGIPPVENLDTTAMPVSSSAAAGGGGGATTPTVTPNTAPPDSWTVRTSFISRNENKLYRLVNGNWTPDPVTVRNTAGSSYDYVEIERPIITFRLSRSYSDLSYLEDIQKYTGKVNLDQFLGYGQGLVLCRGASASKKTDADGAGNVLAYWLVDWEFEYDPLGHDIKLQSVGYQELKGGKLINIVDDNGDQITEKANLDANGAKTNGEPAVLTYGAYARLAMAAEFGSVT